MAVRKTLGELIDNDFSRPETLTDPLPVDPLARLRWLVVQMDAARGLAPAPTATKLPYGVEDIPDPHVLGFNLHEMSADMIKDAVAELSIAACTVLQVTAD